MTAVALEHVSKRYPSGVLAVRDLSLQAAAGELVVLVGPSGCGKTTLLRLLAGLEDPTAGTIRFDGRVVNEVPARERNVALVFQRPALYPHLTVRGNLAFGLEVRQNTGWPTRWFARLFRPRLRALLQATEQERAERVADVASLLHLEDVLGRLPAQLSGGQQQRVALGRALVRQPAVFLFDEPLSNLDGPLRAEMRRQLHLLHRRLPATMIYVTHDPVEALALADRLVVLRAGVVQQADRPLIVYDRPCNRFVAGFLGFSPMSFLEGRLEERDGQWGVAGGAGFLPLPTERAPSWQLEAGREITVGFRPEAVGLTRVNPADVALAMRQVLREPLGGSYLATFQREGWEVTALLRRPQAADDGMEMREVFFDMMQAHWFDGQSGVALDALAAPRPDG